MARVAEQVNVEFAMEKLLHDQKLLASKYEVNFTPLFDYEEKTPGPFVQYGSFRAGDVIQLPLWLARCLESRGRGTMEPPDWLTVRELRGIAERES